MSEATIAQLLQTRLLVAALGEVLPEPWWRCQFLTPTGLSYGKRLFPRGFGQAALSSVTVAAIRDHDAHTGRRSFHLFRFPADVEHRIAEAAQERADWELPTDMDGILRLLDAIEPKANTKFTTGPKSLGSVNGLVNPATAGMLAEIYAESARKQKRVYPYFEAEGDGVT